MTNNYTKPYRTISQQIAILKSRGMLVNDEAEAASYLSSIGYYRLSGYWYPFRERDKHDTSKVTDTFIAKTAFHHAVELYVFDKKLRQHFMDAIERIEVALRVEIALLLGQRDPWAHRDQKYLGYMFAKKVRPDGKTLHERWLEKLDGHTKRSREHFVQQYKQKYDNPLPLWIAIEVWDFGLLSFFIDGMKDKDKNKMAAKYDLPRRGLLVSWVRALNLARNVCAHHARLWNISPVDQPKMPRSGEVAELDHLVGDAMAQRRIYAQAAILQYFMKHINPTSNWEPRLKELLHEFPQAPGVTIAQMGFPDDWESLDLWSS